MTQKHIFTPFARATLLFLALAVSPTTAAAQFYRSCHQNLNVKVSKRDMPCLIGGGVATALMIPSYDDRGGYLDLEPSADIPLPLPVPVCPNGLPVLGPALLSLGPERAKQVLESEAYRSLLDGSHTSWYLAGKFIALAELENGEAWWALSRAALEAENCQYDELVDFYRREAVDAGDEELRHMTSKDEPFWPALLVTTDMERRLGMFDAAAVRLARVKDPIPDKWSEMFAQLRSAIAAQTTARIEVDK